VNDDDRIAVGLGDPGGQLDRLLGGLGSVNRDQDGVEHRRLTSVVAWLAEVSIGRRRPSRLAGLPAQDGRRTRPNRTPSQLAPFTLQRARQTRWINIVVEPHTALPS
jgi:hypothetical protein